MAVNVRQSATLYIRWQNPISGLIKPFRRVLTNVFVSEQGNQIAQRTGIVLNQALFAQIFLQPDLIYVPLDEWNKLSEDAIDGKYSLDVISPQSIFVPYEVSNEFDFDSLSEITQAENIFVNKTPGARRIASIEDNRRGTQRAQHIMIRC